MPDTAYFRPELFEFLSQLKRHNNRAWFARNKSRYQRLVVEPAMLFIGAFGPYLARISPHFVADSRPSRGSLFRIYRDTRFSNDKRPFKTHVGMHFRHAKGKDVHAPGIYVHFEPENCFVAAGIWHPDNPSLTRIRTAICARPGEWKKASRKLELVGDTLKRPPRGFDPQHPFLEDLKRRDFIASVALTESQVCSAKFMRDFFTGCKAMSPLVKFTAEALRLEF